MSTQPYLFNAIYYGGDESELELHLFTTLENDTENSEPYKLGGRIDVETYVRDPFKASCRTVLERALIEGDGKNYSLAVVCPEIPQRDFEVSGILFKHVDIYAFRAWPLFLFTQAAPGA